MPGLAARIRDLSLSAKVTWLIALSLCLLSLVTAGVTATVLAVNAERSATERQEANMRVAWSVLQRHGRSVAVHGDQLSIDGHVLNGDHGAVDRVKELVGGTATIFRGDTRIATNVKNKDGSRATGTRLTSDAVRETVLRDGRNYRGRADILGTNYFTAYDPIRDAHGAVVGILYVGIPAADFLASVHEVQRSIAIVAVLVTLCAAFACLAVTRKMFRPLGEMRHAMTALAGGRLDVAVPGTDRRDEIGAMAKALVVFRDAGEAKARADAEQRQVVDTLAEQLAALANGRLTQRLGQTLPASYATLARDFDRALSSIHGALRGISTGSETVYRFTAELTQASDDLSCRTEQQAASLEETAAAMSAIADTVNNAATGAAGAQEAMHRVHGEARDGGQVVREAVAAMGRLEQASNEISEIIAVIDGIAFQTNLLALNAGVEAARAGDAGKGFAVVASEVRALAGRCSDAATDVRQRIVLSSQQVETGVRLVNDTGSALARITDQIGAITMQVSDIATNAAAQAEGLRQIDIALAQIDGTTQQNAAMVEEVTAVTRKLEAQAGALGSQIARFDVAESPAPLARAA
ncbi:methyl-accepting chemotaxis protein [Sphingomonas sp. 8AM]|uniref:methyl-accepting chemotaxis protein n=1 Tax=Sphingomonas sp. 8AM TaxID=2653170 RepID=UPI0012F03604|nr:methyl-accepting chemotaxis protein [Sphingomonas sp. 8AM]VXC34860.1 Methyl-accepting chemotaxis protein [Sphingomonas sp. 8AM]